MNEELLQFLWKFKLFDPLDIHSTDKQKIDIIKVGHHNLDEGPDFLNAQLQFDGLSWTGPLELHVRSSDWDKHAHQNHPLYENIIAHVVYYHDRDVPYFVERKIPTIELKNYIPENYIQNYQNLIATFQKIPCQPLLQNQLEDYPWTSFYTQKVLEKWENSLHSIENIHHRQSSNWEGTLFSRMAYGLGLKINADVFLELSLSLPFNIIQKISRSELDLLSLLHGKSGLLKHPSDDFQKDLTKRFDYLKHKYSIDDRLFHPKFLRLRPPAFPTIRLAFLANIYHHFPNLFAEIIHLKKVEEVQLMLNEIQANSYFDTHYTYGKESQKRVKKLSQNLATSLMINVILPVQFAYFKSMGKDFSHLIEMLEDIPKEHNSLLSEFEKAGFFHQNAMDSQALLELHKNYCSQKKCLFCNIGLQLMKNDT